MLRITAQLPAGPCAPGRGKSSTHPVKSVGHAVLEGLRLRVKALLNRPRIQVIPFSGPESLTAGPGERRVLMNNRVIVIRQPQDLQSSSKSPSHKDKP